MSSPDWKSVVAQSCCFIVQIAAASVKGRCWIGCNGKSNWTKRGIGSKFICDLVLLLHFAFTSPFPMYTSFRKKRFYSVIQSYYTITDSLQNCKKSILVYQVLISLSLNVCTVKKVHAESQYCPLPLGLFTGNTNHIYFGNVILCAYPSSLTHLMYVDQLR